jgi:hypothetical protein
MSPRHSRLPGTPATALPRPPAAPGAEWRFALAGTTLFALVGLVRLPFHEPWRDEWSPWLFAAASGSLREVAATAAYEGHPSLWFWLVYGAYQLWSDPFSMQVLHLVLATAAAGLVLRFAPWHRGARAALVAGYFPSYEYAVIARNYAVGWLALCVFLAAASARRRRPWLLGLALFALAESSVPGALVAIGLVAYLLVEPFVAAAPERTRPHTTSFAAAGLGILGIAVAIWDASPPPDHQFTGAWILGWHPDRCLLVLSSVLRAALPLLGPGPEFWTVHRLDDQPVAQTALTLTLLAGGALALRRHRAALLLWTGTTAALLLFFYTKYAGYLRHHGHLLLAFLAALWLARSGELRATGPGVLVPRPHGFTAVTLGALLGVHIAAGLYASVQDLRLDFSASRRLANYLREQGLATEVLAGDQDHPASSVAAILGRTFYYPRSDRWGTYVRWDRGRDHGATQADVFARVRALAGKVGRPVWLITNYPLPTAPPGCTEVARFPESVAPYESLYLSRCDPSPPRRRLRPRQPR